MKAAVLNADWTERRRVVIGLSFVVLFEITGRMGGVLRGPTASIGKQRELVSWWPSRPTGPIQRHPTTWWCRSLVRWRMVTSSISFMIINLELDFLIVWRCWALVLPLLLFSPVLTGLWYRIVPTFDQPISDKYRLESMKWMWLIKAPTWSRCNLWSFLSIEFPSINAKKKIIIIMIIIKKGKKKEEERHLQKLMANYGLNETCEQRKKSNALLGELRPATVPLHSFDYGHFIKTINSV